MANSFSVSDDGTKFRCVLDDFTGGFAHNSSYEATFEDGRFYGFTNALLTSPGVRCRGAWMDNAELAGGTINWLAAYRGKLQGGVSYPPYYTDNGGSIYASVTPSGSADVNVGPSIFTTPLSSRPFMTSDAAWWCCDIDPTTKLMQGVLLGAGTCHASIGTADATFTPGSTTVTVVTPLSAPNQIAIVGSHIRNLGDSASTLFPYRIVSVTNSTTFEIDRPYNGSSPGSGKVFSISCVTRARCTSGTFTANSSVMQVRLATRAWNRVLVACSSSTTHTSGVKLPVNTLRWSGVIGSSEGTAPFTGEFGFHANGYLTLDVGLGDITALQPFGDSVVVFCENGMVVLYGTPTFDGVGSLDAHTVYPGVTSSYPRSCDVTPNGVVFADIRSGMYMWTGNGPPREINSDYMRSVCNAAGTNGTLEVAYYRGHVFVVDGTSSSYLYNIVLDSWTLLTNPGAGATPNLFQVGRTGKARTAGYDHELVCATSSGITSASNLVNDIGGRTNGTADLNSGGAGTFPYYLSFTTTHLGNPALRIRPRRMIMTYQMSGSSYITATLKTGTSEVQGANYTFTSGASGFTLFSSGKIGTRAIPVQVQSDNCLTIGVTFPNSAPQYVRQIIVEGDVEGEETSRQ